MNAHAASLRRQKSFREFLLVVPALLFYLVFVIYPLFDGFHYSLTNWDGIAKTFKYVGLNNYVTLAGDKRILEPLGNTFIFAFLTTIIMNVLGLIMAVGAERVRHGKNFFRALLFVPAVLSSIVVGYVWNFLFGNVFNVWGKAIGFTDMANNLLGSKKFSLYMCILVSSWKMAGWYMVIYIAGLQGIDQSIYEAAELDGATGWIRFRHVVFPLLAPAFTINMVLALERAFKEYDLVFALTGGGPGRSSELVSMTIYNEIFNNKRAGYGAALGIVLFLIIVAITLFEMKVLRRREDNANDQN